MGVTTRLLGSPRGRSVVDRLQSWSRLSHEASLVVVFIGEDQAQRNPSIAGMCLHFVWTPHLKDPYMLHLTPQVLMFCSEGTNKGLLHKPAGTKAPTK